MARSTAKHTPIPFMKLSGSGNDFILVDNRRGIVAGTRASALAAKICAHRMSVGGDGLILIERSRKADFRWRLFNADGSEAEFSGNGARCAARFAYLKKIAPKRMTFETLAGMIEAEMVVSAPGRKPEVVKVRFPDPKGLRLNLSVAVNGTTRQAHFLDTGVPHCVYLVDDPDKADIVGVGRPTRYHDLFKPAGANVNFIKVLGPHRIRIRTYERGVEDETLACGTGAVASVVIGTALGKLRPPVDVKTPGGEILSVGFRPSRQPWEGLYLEGPARILFEGSC